MSAHKREPETVGEKIDAIRQSLPPKEGRRTRLPHISWEDLAELIGVKPTTLHKWRRDKGYPDESNRLRLAELSNGRFKPDDFKKPTEAERQTQMGILREELSELAANDRRQAKRLAELQDRLERLERVQSEPQDPPAPHHGEVTGP